MPGILFPGLPEPEFVPGILFPGLPEPEFVPGNLFPGGPEPEFVPGSSLPARPPPPAGARRVGRRALFSRADAGVCLPTALGRGWGLEARPARRRRSRIPSPALGLRIGSRAGA